MKNIALFLSALIFSLCVILSAPDTVEASGNLVLHGRILDLDGNPVEGGEIFAYDSAQTRRPADFISPKSDSRGTFRMELPAGKYWLVARVRTGAKYGPLGTGGRHSGEAQESEGAAGEELELEFAVADVREMARKMRKGDDDYLTVEGRILDQEGRPVPGAYAFASREKGEAGIPEFISAWSGADGSYNLRLPSGRYQFGASTSYPPGDGITLGELELGSAPTNSRRDITLPVAPPQSEPGDHEGKEND